MLRKEWESEMSDIILSKDLEFENTLKGVNDENLKRIEAANLKQIQVEETKWKLKIADIESKHSSQFKNLQTEMKYLQEAYESINQTVVDCSNSKLEAEKKHAELIISIKSEYDKIITDLKLRLKEEKLADLFALEKQMTEKFKVELEEQLLEKEKNVRNEADKVWQSKLLKEHQKMDGARLDLSRHTAKFSEDRDTLQLKINQLEIYIKKLESDNEQEKIKIKEQFTLDRMKMDLEHEKEKKKMTSDLLKNAALVAETTEKQNKQYLEEQLQLERVKMSVANDSQMALLQEENEKLISSLENAMVELRNEKQKLSLELDMSLSKIENAEDALYDYQQLYKNQEKKYAFTILRSAVKFRFAEANFNKELKLLNAASGDENKQNNLRFEEKIQNLIILSMKLSYLVFENEKYRESMHSVLLSHKTDVLLEIRTQLRLYEKEIIRINQEKDTIEDQKNSILDQTGG
jgi:hypothetical protein